MYASAAMPLALQCMRICEASTLHSFVNRNEGKYSAINQNRHCDCMVLPARCHTFSMPVDSPLAQGELQKLRSALSCVAHTVCVARAMPVCCGCKCTCTQQQGLFLASTELAAATMRGKKCPLRPLGPSLCVAGTSRVVPGCKRGYATRDRDRTCDLGLLRSVTSMFVHRDAEHHVGKPRSIH